MSKIIVKLQLLGDFLRCGDDGETRGEYFNSGALVLSQRARVLFFRERSWQLRIVCESGVVTTDTSGEPSSVICVGMQRGALQINKLLATVVRQQP